MLLRFILFCFSFLLLSSALKAQDNAPLPPDGSSWFVGSFGMLGYQGSGSFFLQGDTLIADQSYKKLVNDDSDYAGCLRSEEGRWYTVTPEETEEYLLYDYNLAVGDTFWINIPDPFELYVPYLIVDSIDTVTLLDNSERFRWILEYSNPDFESDPPYFGYGEWIQGIGSTMGPLTIVDCGWIDCGWTELICLNDNSQLLYEEAPGALGNWLGETYIYENCSISLNTDELDPLTFLIFPNPAQDLLRVELLQSEQLYWTIFSMDGRRVLEGALPPGETNHQISLSSLSSGTYIFQLKAESGRSSSQLLMRE